jgi:hypothetical protein
VIIRPVLRKRLSDRRALWTGTIDSGIVPVSRYAFEKVWRRPLRCVTPSAEADRSSGRDRMAASSQRA